MMITSENILNAKILIVDDLEVNIILLKRMLHGVGYTSIDSTMNPGDVYTLHKNNCYDLILLDLQMPGMDGFQVMEELKKIETGSYLPVLVITAQPNHKLRALQAGAKDFVSKPFELAEVLARVYNMLEVRLLHEESKKNNTTLENYINEIEESRELIRKNGENINNLYRQVIEEQKISERLLLNVLPQPIAERLKGRLQISSDEVIADYFPAVTVLFADIVGFTTFSTDITPTQLVKMLNEIFTNFDNIAVKYGLEKIKTIGDAYMAAAGLPVTVSDHAIRAANMALEMIDSLNLFNQQKNCHLQIRIGLNSGAVVAGVIGQSKFSYDLWGDTVNAASRMESHGIPGRIHITESTRLLLSGLFTFEERGYIEIKNMGAMQTFFLIQKKY